MSDRLDMIRRARLRVGLTQEQLAERSELSTRTVRALENDEQASPRMATLLRVATALGMTAEDHRDLVAAWGFDARRTPLPIEAMMDESGRHDQLLRLLEDSYDAAHLAVSIRSVVYDEDYQLVREKVERVIAADRRGVDTVFLLVGGIGDPRNRLRLLDAEGFTVRRTVDVPRADSIVYELALPRALERGEHYGYGMTIEYQPPPVGDSVLPTSLGVWFPRPALLCVFRADFSAARAPEQLRQVYREGLDGAFRDVRPLTATAAGMVQLVLTEPGPGWHGISWA